MTYKKVTAALAVATIVGLGVLGATGYLVVHAFTGSSIKEDADYQVVNVSDGDTFEIQLGNRIATVRMLGIDTPETVDPRKPIQCFGKEASDETKELLIGKMVKLKLNPNREEKDKYGRFLAYVYLDDYGKTFVNKFLLENGFAREYTYGTAYMYQKEFREIEKIAKESKKGLWGVCEVVENNKSKSL